MATLISRANGNLTGSTAFAAIATGTGASQLAGLASTAINANTTATSDTFTITNGEIVDGVLLQFTNNGTTGTFTVKIRKAGVDQQSVTLNHADLPTSKGWFFFKFPSTVTGAGTADYTLQIVNPSGASTFTVFYTSSTSNWNRALRTTTTATPNAADDLYIVGELTQAAALTFTANSTQGSATLTNVSSFTGLSVGQTLFQASLFAAGSLYTIASLDPGASSLTLSAIVNSTATALTFNAGATLTDLTVTMDQVASNTGVYQRVFTGDTSVGSSAVTNVSSTSGLSVGNPVTGSTLATSAGASYPPIISAISTNLTLLASSGSMANTAGTGTSITALTGYGAISIGYRGTLQFGTSASTDYLLRFYGDLNVWSGGTLNVGTTDTPIPRSSTAVLETGPNTDGGYGLICNDGSTVNMQGLSRTSGKNVVACKAVGGRFTGNTVQTGTTISNVSDFTNVAVGQAIRSISTITEAANTTSLPNTPLTIAAFDTGAGTITLSGAAVGTTTAALLATGPVAGATGFTVDTDTGWLSGDLIAIASTSRTAADCEVGKLTADAGASSLAANGFVAAATGQVLPLTGSGGLLATHMGYPGIQAEIINLTRNVKVRSISPTLMTYVFLAGLAVADIDWTEFYYLGENAVNKKGIEIGASNPLAGEKNLQFCSIHDCEDGGFAMSTSSTSMNLVFSNNVMWNCGSVTGPAFNFSTTNTNNDWVVSNNVIIRTLNGNGVTLADIGGTFTNNTVVGASQIGMLLNESSAVLGTFSGNVAHSNGSTGVNTIAGQSGTISDTTAWRNSSSGLGPGAMHGAHFDGLVLFGNSSQNISLPSSGEITFTDAVLNGDSSFSTTSGVGNTSTGCSGTFTFNDCSFGVASGILTAHTNDLPIGSLMSPKYLLNNCLLGSATEVAAQYNLSPRAIVASAKHDQVAGSHKFWKKGGTGQSDTTIYRTAEPSERLTPASNITTLGAVLGPFSTSAATVAGATVVPLSYGLDKISVGDFLFSTTLTLGIVTAKDAGAAGSFTVDRPLASQSIGSNWYIQPKLESSPRLVAVDSGATKSVSVWVRKQQENLASYSEDYSQSVWTINAFTSTTGQADPLGGTGATKFLETATVSVHNVIRATTITVVSGKVYTFSAYVKPEGGRQWFYININGQQTWFDLTNEVVGTQGHTSAAITEADAGFYRLSLTFTSAGTGMVPSVRTAQADNTAVSFGGDTSKGFTLFGLQLEAGSSASPYQVTGASNQPGYNGSQPRLVCKANPAVGLDTDTVIDTMSVAWGEWEVLTGTTPSPSGDKGVLELVVDCDGTTGFVNVDDWQVAA